MSRGLNKSVNVYPASSGYIFAVCKLSCEKKPLPTAVQVSILHARNSSRDFATDSQATLIVKSVIKWHEFRGIEKNCDNSNSRKTHAMF